MRRCPKCGRPVPDPEHVYCSVTCAARAPKPRYSGQEDDFLRQHYPHKGAIWCARRLGRSRASIYKRACRLGLRHGHAEHGIPAPLAARLIGVSRRWACELARREGVARRVGDTYYVPEAWAEAKACEYAARLEAEHSGYLSTPQAARILGVTTFTLEQWLKGRGELAAVLEGVRVLRGLRDRCYLNPWDVEQAARKLARLREGVPAKRVALERGLHPGAAYRMIRKLSNAHKGLRNGRVMWLLRELTP